MNRPGSASSLRRAGLIVVVVLAAGMLVAYTAVGFHAVHDLRRRQDIESESATFALQQCLFDRIERAVPAGSRVAIVGTDSLWRQTLIAHLFPGIQIVGRADRATHTLRMTGQLPGVPCDEIVVDVQPVR